MASTHLERVQEVIDHCSAYAAKLKVLIQPGHRSFVRLLSCSTADPVPDWLMLHSTIFCDGN